MTSKATAVAMKSRLRELATSLSSELAANQQQQQSSATQDIDLMEVNPLDLFCSSIDTLRGTPIDQMIPPNSVWAPRPNRISGVGGSDVDDDRDEIELMCRRGVPPALRCATWIINVTAAANPGMPKSECDEFGTFRKVRVIDHGWDLTLKSLFPDDSDFERADVLDFGLGHDAIMNILLHDHGGSPIPDNGIQSLTKVLHAGRDSLGIEFCPLLPDITCLLLSYMPVRNLFINVLFSPALRGV